MTLAHAAPPAARGAVLVLLAGVLFSFGGLIVRQIELAGDWQIVFYRSTGIAVGLLLVMALRDRRSVADTFRRAGLPGLAGGCAISVSMVTFILAINATSVANALFLLAASPFMAAVIAWLLLRESVTRATWLAMAAALAGIAVMVWHGLIAGTLYGNAMGLVTALGFAAFSVALRFGRESDMIPAVCVAGAISATVAAAVVLSRGAGFEIPAREVAICLFYGALIATGLSMVSRGARTVPAAALTLLSLTEVLLGPVWVWLGIGEVPDTLTLIGGAILLAAIAGQALASWRRT